ncbi:MAG: hypothetical protein ACOZFS_12005 [Thermodesulfobacteriota bacterium]
MSERTGRATGNNFDENIEHVLQAIDRELSFYRRRAGQVFFLGLLLEVLILAGKEQIAIKIPWVGIRPFVYSIFFIAVAFIGIALGYEYRNRIHILKEARNRIIIRYKLDDIDIYPKTGGIIISEIVMLYVVLSSLSTCGIIIVWLNEYYTSKEYLTSKISQWYHILLIIFVFIAISSIIYAWKKYLDLKEMKNKV